MTRAEAGIRSTQEQRRAEAERRLLDAAAELIGEVGPPRVTLAMVGARAGYSRGLATHHFGSKDALMQRVVEVVTERFRDALARRPSPASAMDEVLGLVRTYIDIVSDLPALHRARLVLTAHAVATPPPGVRPAMAASDRSFREEVARGIERGVASGEFPRAVDASGLATAIVGMLRGVAFQAMIDPQVDLEATRREIEQLLGQRLRPRAESTPLESREGTAR